MKLYFVMLFVMTLLGPVASLFLKRASSSRGIGGLLKMSIYTWVDYCIYHQPYLIFIY